MELLFKKYFWVVNLVVLAVAAYLIAQTIMDVVSAKYLTVPPESMALSTETGDVKLLERVDDKDLAQTLLNRSPFNVDDREDEGDPQSCTPKCTGKSCGDDGCGGSCGDCADGETCGDDGSCEEVSDGPQESELNIKLVGTMVHPVDPDYKFANVMLNGSNTEMVTVGSELLGQATVVDILPKFMYLQEGKKITHVGLWSESSGKKARKKPKSRVRPSIGKRPDPSASVRSKPRRSKMDYSKGVKKTGDFEYQIDKQMLDEQLTDLTALGMQARVIPNYRKGKYEGFKLVGVRPGSLYRSIGIRSGDIIRSINGRAINSPNKAMELFTQLKSSSNISMEIERRGKIETFNYNIQ